MISGDVRQNDIGTRVRIDPIPNIEHEISSARVSVSHSQLTSMRRIEHSDQPGDYYEEPQISTVSTSEVVALQQGKESHLGMGVPGADRAEFKTPWHWSIRHWGLASARTAVAWLREKPHGVDNED